MASRLDPQARLGMYSEPIYRALYEAIPQEEEDKLMQVCSGTTINGGTSRGWHDVGAAICTYNNTIGSREEIIAWYRRAHEIAASLGEEVVGSGVDF